MSIILKPTCPNEIKQLINEYLQKYGTYLVDILLISHLHQKFAFSHKCKITIDFEDTQKILQQITEWKVSNIVALPYLCKKYFADKNTYLSIIEQRPKMLKGITQISFPYLQRIQMNKCGIVSIEDLEFLDCPRLAWLDLNANCISSLKPITKMYFPKLYTIGLSNNKFPVSQLNMIKRSTLLPPRQFNVCMFRKTLIGEGYSQRLLTMSPSQIGVGASHTFFFPKGHKINKLLTCSIDSDLFCQYLQNYEQLQVYFGDEPEEEAWCEKRFVEVEKLMDEFQLKIRKLNRSMGKN